MINGNEKNKKYITNIQKNGRNYNINLYTEKEKLEISIKSIKNNKSKVNYANNYSLRQLKIINYKYFNSFDNLENICIDLDEQIKNNNISIEEINEFIILSITIVKENESVNIIFKLYQNNETDFHLHTSNLTKNINPFSIMLKNPKKEDSNIYFKKRKNSSSSKEIELGSNSDDDKKNKSKNILRNQNSKSKNKSKKNYNNEDSKSSNSNSYKNEEKKEKEKEKEHEEDEDNESNLKYKSPKKNNKSGDESSDDEITKNSRKYRKIKKEKEVKNDEPRENKRKKKKRKKRRKKRKVSSSEEKNDKEENNKNITTEISIIRKEDLKRLEEMTGLPMPERENLKNFVNSRIFFTKNELQMVKNKITKGVKNKHAYFETLYRASIDKDYENSINLNCEGIYPQLILFYCKEGQRFGIYIEKEKHTGFFGHISYREVPGTSFLISLNSLKIYDILEGKKATEDREEKLCFGRSFLFNENGSNWLIFTPRNEFLNTKCMLGDKENSFGKININEIVGKKNEYTLRDVEIFKVIVYSDDEDKDNDECSYISEKEIKTKNFSKNSVGDDDTIKVRNYKIQQNFE